jgi:hypothetical protein
MIKSVNDIAERKVILIPSKEGDIPLSDFDYTNTSKTMKLKIHSLKEKEKMQVEQWTKFPQSEFYVNVPSCGFMMKKFYETGEYKMYNGKTENYFTFSFNKRIDLAKFKMRLYKKDWFISNGFSPPNYEDILKDIPYIKKYKVIA